MQVIGLCGGSGSGKGEVARVFIECGIPVIDADETYHKLTSTKSDCLEELCLSFGYGILGDNGTLDRVKLRHAIYTNDNFAESLSLLNKITHKHIIREMLALCSEYANRGERAVVLDAPLLFEAGLDAECSHIISVVADESLRIERIIKRDGVAKDEAMKRIAAQKSNDWLISHSDTVIQNNGGLDELTEITKRIIKNII